MNGKLTEATIKGMRPAAEGKTYKRADGDGLYIEVFDDGKRRWRFRYSMGDGKRYVKGLGVWPNVSLKDARALREEAAEQVKRGINPVEAARARRNGTADQGDGRTFAAVALAWQKHHAATWSEGHAKITAQRIEQYLLPPLRGKSAAEITPADMLAIVKPIEAKGRRDTARRVTAIASQIFKHAILMGLASVNPADAIRAALAPAGKPVHMKHTTEPGKLAAFMLACEQYQGNAATRMALVLAPYLLLRPGELRRLTWEQVDFERAELRLPIEAMKRKRTEKEAAKGAVAHIVPLARQPLALFKLWREEQRGGGKGFVFTARPGQAISNATMSRALGRLGDVAKEQTIHGWRHTASSILHEQGFDSRIIEKQLAHADLNRIRGIYNHAEYQKERREMLQAWADWLTEAKAKAKEEMDGFFDGGDGQTPKPGNPASPAPATEPEAERREEEEDDYLEMMLRQQMMD